MDRKSTWYLITSDEIEQIRTGLQAVGTDPRNNPVQTREMLTIIEKIRERLA